ncbi:hypothetical protein ACLQ2S_00435 [Micromonospora sp. DT48]|uniref:hypothetical protein n=1 Tax=unclassified Micromonospora TaxID=2617518 RepID=UPI0012BD7B9B|nr:hypothetical protein [Micromonospora sp. CP22]MTK00931.1 hypothetical protein [Micromonospora sp. CP22]
MTHPTWPGLLRDAFNATALDDDVVKGARRHKRRGMIRSVGSVPGALSGVVQDGAEFWHVNWRIAPIDEAGWAEIERDIHADPVVMVALLESGAPARTRDVEEILSRLVPDPADLEATCDCADWLVPCAHALAVGLAFAEATRDDVWALLLLRGRGRDWLVVSEAAARARRLLDRLGGRPPSEEVFGPVPSGARVSSG